MGLIAKAMDKLKLTGVNLGRVFNYRRGRAGVLIDKYTHIINTAKLKVENSAQTSFRFSPVSFLAPCQSQKKQIVSNEMSLL